MSLLNLLGWWLLSLFVCVIIGIAIGHKEDDVELAKYVILRGWCLVNIAMLATWLIKFN